MNYNSQDIVNNYSVDFDFDAIEPEINRKDYYEISKQFISKLDDWITILLKKEPKSVALWAMAFAIGAKFLEGQSMSSVAKKIGVTKAAISKQARIFCKEANLPPSPYMSPNRKRYGKETKEKRIIRVAMMVDDDDLFHKKVGELLRELIDSNINLFEDGIQKDLKVTDSKLGRLYRNYTYESGTKEYTDIKEVFIVKSAVKKLFKGINNTDDVIKALKKSDIFIKATARQVDFQLKTGYLIKY